MVSALAGVCRRCHRGRLVVPQLFRSIRGGALRFVVFAFPQRHGQMQPFHHIHHSSWLEIGGFKSIAHLFDNVSNLEVMGASRHWQDLKHSWRTVKFAFEPPLRAGERRTVIITYNVDGALLQSDKDSFRRKEPLWQLYVVPRWLHQWREDLHVGLTTFEVKLSFPVEAGVKLLSPDSHQPFYNAGTLCSVQYESLPRQPFCLAFAVEAEADQCSPYDSVPKKQFYNHPTGCLSDENIWPQRDKPFKLTAIEVFVVALIVLLVIWLACAKCSCPDCPDPPKRDKNAADCSGTDVDCGGADCGSDCGSDCSGCGS